MLFKKRVENVDNTLKSEISDLRIEIKELKARFLAIELENEALRNKVLRKIQTKKEINRDFGQYAPGQKVKFGDENDG